MLRFGFGRCSFSTTSTKMAPRPRRDDSPDVKLSKSMSYILRHGAAKEKIAMAPDGYVAVNDMLKHRRFKGATLEDVQRIVETNNKKRFAIKQEADMWYVRANQGHSVQVEVEMKKLAKLEDFPDVVVHGTNLKAWETIKIDGLSKMKRNHIHLACGKWGDEGVVSGMRASASVYIYIDIAKALEQGIEFEESDNGVILTKGDTQGKLPPELFLKVEDRNGKSLL